MARGTDNQDLGRRRWIEIEVTARAAGGVADEDYDVLEAGFSERADGSGLAVMFQRELSAEPWEGDPETDDYFSNSYCVTLGSGETVYGELEQVSFSGTRGTFHFADHAAGILRTGRQLVVDFEVPEGDLRVFQEVLQKVVTWGVPSQVPHLNGFS
ncbi:hypothetical protein ACFVZM_14280 [Streptomyces sioyaensis]|uniref:hypothetical protein n=1 Tax=Streptomyces sioyaensis TaxID=67364 RepID=UPI0036A744E9